MKEKENLCRCVICSTHLGNKLKGEPFCANGSAKARTIVEAGCNCQGCPIHKDFAGVQFCMGGEAIEVKHVKHTEKTVIDLDTSNASVGAKNIKVIDLTQENLQENLKLKESKS